MMNPNNPSDPNEFLYIYYTLTPLGEDVFNNYDDANFPYGWEIIGCGAGEYKVDNILYQFKEQHSIQASKKVELFNKLIQYLNGLQINNIITHYAIRD